PLRFHKAGRNLVRRNCLVPGPAVPPVRYNATDPKDISLEENAIVEGPAPLSASFRSALERARASAGPEDGP
ncbi:MAG: hypothetical protein J7M21_03060, partial [Planctomycetes bacterium]|nr:hypothetical protein [Planctomycetota bacterium]